jgi:glucosamine--fructose-6-phosphate aminotransferase (isomerizing)
MCGIVGYIGNKQAQHILLSGLKRLEYRGYDSSGVAIVSSQTSAVSVIKSPGKILSLEKLLAHKPLSGCVGIAHTRWATHGEPNQVNSHPHCDCDHEIAVVHNGIIENFAKLKLGLIKEGHTFLSQTDTEVIVHLIEKYYRKSKKLEDAVRSALSKLEGSFAIGVVSQKEPAILIGARLGSPLVVGVGKDENFIASDVPALLDFIKDVVYLGDNEMAVLTKDAIRISKVSGEIVNHKPVRVAWDISQAQKQGWPHFMIKEINEQPGILEGILHRRIKNNPQKVFFEELKIPAHILAKTRKISIVACGTAYHAGMCGKYIFEELCRIPVSIDVSSEFRYRDPIVDADTLTIAISQSGETADTLAAVKESRSKGSRVLAICNVLGSSLVRESDGVVYTHAGPEIGVASTKAYTAQLAVLYLLALYLADIKKLLPADKIARLITIFKTCSRLQREVLKDQNSVKSVAQRHSHLGSFLFLGRNINFPLALEGALKLKEISYIPAEGYAAGEMKHGPIALIDEYRAVVCIAPQSSVYEKMISNIQEIRSRRGKIIALASKNDDKITALTKEVIYVPNIPELFSPLVIALPLQLLAYHIAVKRGCDVDQPRNLAKSVTVE